MADWSRMRDPLFADGLPADYAGTSQASRCDECGRWATHVYTLPRESPGRGKPYLTICQKCYYRPPDGPAMAQGRLFGDDEIGEE